MNLIIKEKYNTLFDDPIKNKQKYLFLEYINVNDIKFIKIYEENEFIILNNIKKITLAKYGIEYSWNNILNKLINKLSKEKISTNKIIKQKTHINDGYYLTINEKYNKLFGDPCRYIEKKLIINYVDNNDKVIKKIYNEDEYIYLKNIKSITNITYGSNTNYINLKSKFDNLLSTTNIVKKYNVKIHNYDFTEINIDKLSNLYNGDFWKDYQLGDCIGFRGNGRSKIKNKKYDNTIASIYHKNSNIQFNLITLYDIFACCSNYKKPKDNVIVMHVRVGDSLDIRDKGRGAQTTRPGIRPMDLNKIKLLLKNDKYKHLNEIHVLFGAHKKSKCYKNSINYLKEVKNKFKNYKLKFIMSKNPDFDFYYMCHSKYFIQGGGRYSNIISIYVKSINNTVINDNMMPECGEETKHKHWNNTLINFKKYINK
jgi:hypothetical protein